MQEKRRADSLKIVAKSVAIFEFLIDQLLKVKQK